ncbi:MAG TPA: ArnT family glycosyltransferase [Candidatus Brocadiia bacterium]|nr:glycosyltransferase family 39 protein [Candidatus Brocadiales bacterium]
MLSKIKNIYIEIAFVCIFAISFFFLSSRNLKKPGVQYDELVAASTAMELITGKRILNLYRLHILGKDIPINATKKRGALEAYILTGVFSAFGINVYSFRVTTITIGTVALVLAYFFTKKMFGQKAAIISIILLTIDPSYMLYVRHDFGDVVIMLACKMGSLLCLYNWWRTGRLLHLSLGTLLMAFGLWELVNFIWFVIALPLSVSILYPKELKSKIGVKEILCGLFLIAFITLELLFFMKRKLFLNTSSVYTEILNQPWSVFNFLILHIKHKFAILRIMLLENTMPEFTLGVLPKGLLGMKGAFTYYLFLISSIIFFFTLYMNFRNRAFNKKHLFIPLMGLFIFLQIVITPEATGGHHTMMLYPFIHIFLGTTLACLFDYFRNKTHYILKIVCSSFVIVLIIFTVASNLATLKSYYKELEKSGGRGNWSDAIYDLAEYIKKQGDVPVLAMDWGFTHNLLFLSEGRINIRDSFWRYVSGQDRHIRELFLKGNRLFLFHSPRYTNFKPPLEAFNETIKKSGVESVVQQNFHQRDGEHIYSVYKILTPNEMFDKKVAGTLEPYLRHAFLKSTLDYKSYINFCEDGFQKQIGKGWDNFVRNKKSECHVMGKEGVVYLKKNIPYESLEIAGHLEKKYFRGQILKMSVFLNGIKAAETLVDKFGAFTCKATIPPDLKHTRFIKVEIMLEKQPMLTDSGINDDMEMKIAVTRIALTKES